ncbi:MAG: bifunctional [glutamate--ammonia ligase]-adenylyl-L-tyrosine phosphorylase/[glutamate--ammonia-ligase] adenylyltransferase [Deltaproteobacteria bacterium]|nr:bifunctional [glutamate--ammonia ligase]-adenylyl-L-tyrosine phosphorylase/[glutamate--ammonia-ligase] adenylyltransferase [Deltaproteobacteria bacterium]
MTLDILNRPEAEALSALKGLGFLDARAALKNLLLMTSGAAHRRAGEILKSAADSPSPDSALNNLESVLRELPEGLLEKTVNDIAALRDLIYICGSSRLLSSTISQNPEYLRWLFFDGGLSETRDFSAFRSGLDDLARGAGSVEGICKGLRVYKQKEYLRIGARDLLRVAPVEETTRELSDLAAASLDCAVEFSLSELKKGYGRPICSGEDESVKEAEFTVIGMGKLGGRELNFSSDIDIIYIYSSDKGETEGVAGSEASRISLHAFFVKLSTMVNKLIGSRTEDGMVFRIDLDLRPEGRGGDMANSLRSAEIYYESWGQSWERAAMIKARVVAGSRALGEAFLSMIRPFVFRKYLDFTAIEEIKSMKERIDLSLLRKNSEAIDVKLGAGGIREIEFFCQALQLIHGGRDAGIRGKNTLKTIDRLLLKGYIKEDEAASLRQGYVFLRNLEHRIQIVEGRQTQAMPARAEELERLARMMGFKDTAGKLASALFLEEYRKRTAFVHEVYRSLFYRAGGKEEPEEVLELFSPDMTGEEAGARLERLGFKDPATAWKNLSLLKTRPPYARLSAKARMLLQKLAPGFVSLSAASPDPDRALAHLERFISSVGARTAFYSLLAENPPVCEELVRLFGTSVFLSKELIERPESLDMLLSKELALPYKRRAGFFDEFAEGLERAADYEERLDLLRRIKGLEIFRIGINGILGNLSPGQVSAQITFLAEAAIETALKISCQELARTHGEPLGARFSVIGLGKLGGKELIYGSDLDIIFVYEDGGAGSTDGRRPISNHEFFVKLAQRTISALTLRTREGFAFNVDTRLRPSGSAGALVISKDALLKYHREKTQVWERQAFTKARPVAGDLALGFEALKGLEDILYSKPLVADDVDEMLRIRKRMELEIAKEGPDRYNIKTGRGGLVDIEFLAQALQLKYGMEKKGLRTLYTLKALWRLFKEGLLPEDEYLFLKEAHLFYRLLEMQLRIVRDRPEGYLIRGSEELSTLARRTGYSGKEAAEALLKDYLRYSGKVREIYLKTLEGIKGV